MTVAGAYVQVRGPGPYDSLFITGIGAKPMTLLAVSPTSTDWYHVKKTGDKLIHSQ